MQHWISFLFALLLLATPALGQGREEAIRAEYQQRLRTLRIEAGGRHLELGIDMRRRGMVAQAAAEIVLAVEVSERMHPGANRVLSLMRRFDESFWRRRVQPTPARLDQYEQRARRVRQKNREERFALSEYARRRGLEEEARAGFLFLLQERGEPLELDGQGRIVMDVGTIHADVSRVLREAAITINGRLYLRDAFLEHLSDLTEIFEHSSERLRVRCQTSTEDASALHALGSALLPHLEAELGGRPARRMQVFVFADRETYEVYLKTAGLTAHRAVAGFAIERALTAVICAEGLDPASVQGLVLHELTHLAEHLVTPARMPAWFREGLAETFGGRGAFTWDGARLETGLTLDRALLEPLLEPDGRWPIAALAAIDPLALWSRDRAAAQRFYTQSWALYQFFTRHAPSGVRSRFDDWLAMSRGSAADTKDVQRLFDEQFGADFDAIESAFARWLEGL